MPIFIGTKKLDIWMDVEEGVVVSVATSTEPCTLIIINSVPVAQLLLLLVLSICPSATLVLKFPAQGNLKLQMFYRNAGLNSPFKFIPAVASPALLSLCCSVFLCIE